MPVCGIGPVEHSFPALFVTCLPPALATYLPILTSELRSRGCDPVLDADPVICASAADSICRAQGHEGGWGPVEWNATDSAVVCLGD